MGCSAGVRVASRGSDVRRRGDLRGAAGAPTTAPIPSCSDPVWWRARRRTRSRDDGQLWGNPRVRLAGAAPAAVPLVGRAAAADAVAVRSGPDRPLPGVRVLLGRARGGAHGGGRDAGSAARARGVRCGFARELGAARAGGRGPRRDHAGGDERCATRSGFRGWSCSSSGSTRVRPGACTGSRTTSRIASCTRGRTTTTRRGGGIPGCRATRVRSWTRRSRGSAWSSRAAVVEPDPAGAALAGAGRDDPGAGRARAGERGADEQPGAGGTATGGGGWSAGR